MTTLPVSMDLADTDAPSSTGRTIVLRDLRRLDPSSMPAETLRSTIDEHLFQLQASVRAIEDAALHLRHLRNTSVPALRLPPEILVRIFALARFTSPGERDLVTATHICRRWRDVALDHPWLWTTVTVTTVDKATTFLERAQDGLLAIVIRDGAIIEPFTPRLESLMPRLRSLDVDVLGSGFMIQLVKRLTCCAAPHLETFHIVGQIEDHEKEVKSAQVMNLWLDDQGIMPNTPSLRSVRLSPVLPPWDSQLYRNLSVLELGGMAAAARLSEQALLQILQQCPALARLKLEVPIATPLSTPEADDPRWKVSLPLLSHITLYHTPHAHVVGLLSRLILPATVRYEIIGSVQDAYEEATGHTAVSTPLAAWKDFDRVEVHPGRPKANDLLSYLFLSSAPDSADPLMTLCIPDVLRHGHQRAIRLGIPHSTRVLMIRGWSRAAQMSPADWVPIFQSTPYLRVLQLKKPGAGLASILNALGPQAVKRGKSARRDDNPAAGWPCPELESLELVGVQLSTEVEELVVGLLRDRAQVGLALKAVEFARSDEPSAAFLGCIQATGTAVHIVDVPPKWYADTTTFTLKF